MLPDFLIIGAQKSASTFVHECLREHPEVFMPKAETPFFEDPFYVRNSKQLEALFDRVRDERVVGIKRSDYFGRPECPERIYVHIPDPQFILILRDPIERAISAYYWYMRQGYIPVRPLEEGMRNIIGGLYKDQFPRSQEIIDYGLYYRHLVRYLRYFAREKFLIMLYCDLKEDGFRAMRRIYRFLQVRDDYVPKSLYRNPKRTVYSFTRIWLLRLRNPFIHTYYTCNRNVMMALPRNGIVATLVKAIFYSVDCLLFKPVCDNVRPRLSACLGNKLLDIYIEDVNALEEFLGQDLSDWKRAT